MLFAQSHARVACLLPFPTTCINAQLVLPEASAADEGGHVRAVQDCHGQGHGVRFGEHQVRALYTTRRRFHVP